MALKKIFWIWHEKNIKKRIGCDLSWAGLQGWRDREAGTYCIRRSHSCSKKYSKAAFTIHC